VALSLGSPLLVPGNAHSSIPALALTLRLPVTTVRSGSRQKERPGSREGSRDGSRPN